MNTPLNRSIRRSCMHSGGEATPSAAVEEQEDMFFARHVAANPAMRLAPRAVAAAFCLEVPCDDLAGGRSSGTSTGENLSKGSHPFGMHAAWYYNAHSKVKELLDESLRNLLPGR